MKKDDTMTGPAGTKWILVMDDEEDVRTVMRLILEGAGYRAYLAKDGDEAVACYQEAQQCGYPFDVVILDATIQGGGEGGRETIRKLLASDPGVKAIAVSGYIGDPAITDFSAYGFKGALTKPFRGDELKQAVERALDLRERTYDRTAT